MTEYKAKDQKSKAGSPIQTVAKMCELCLEILALCTASCHCRSVDWLLSCALCRLALVWWSHGPAIVVWKLLTAPFHFVSWQANQAKPGRAVAQPLVWGTMATTLRPTLSSSRHSLITSVPPSWARVVSFICSAVVWYGLLLSIDLLQPPSKFLPSFAFHSFFLWWHQHHTTHTIDHEFSVFSFWCFCWHDIIPSPPQPLLSTVLNIVSILISCCNGEVTASFISTNIASHSSSSHLFSVRHHIVGIVTPIPSN